MRRVLQVFDAVEDSGKHARAATLLRPAGRWHQAASASPSRTPMALQTPPHACRAARADGSHGEPRCGSLFPAGQPCASSWNHTSRGFFFACSGRVSARQGFSAAGFRRLCCESFLNAACAPASALGCSGRLVSSRLATLPSFTRPQALRKSPLSCHRAIL